jgi:hypothetical protein
MDDVAFAAGSSSASMDAFAGSSSSAAPTDPSHGWQKVVYPKRNRKHAAPSAAPTSAAPDLVKPNVFEGVDKRSQERHRAIQAARDAAAEADGSIAAWADYSDDGSDSDEAARPQPEEVKKPKKPKVKKPKVTVADAAALIDAENLAAHLIDVSVSNIPYLRPLSPSVNKCVLQRPDLARPGMDHGFVSLLRVGSGRGLELDLAGSVLIPVERSVLTSFVLSRQIILLFIVRISGLARKLGSYDVRWDLRKVHQYYCAARTWI